jgi:predicted dinucleotide-utilizing enzyme
MSTPRRVGIVGYGNLGRYLVGEVLKRPDCLQLAFVWNRTESVFDDTDCSLDKSYILRDLNDFASRQADLIAEVAHPSVASQYGGDFLRSADFLVRNIYHPSQV